MGHNENVKCWNLVGAFDWECEITLEEILSIPTINLQLSCN
jgi:hypothetical protein